MFGANVNNVLGLCLLGIGGIPDINHKIHIFDLFSETIIRGPEDCLNLGHHNLVKL